MSEGATSLKALIDEYRRDRVIMRFTFKFDDSATEKPPTLRSVTADVHDLIAQLHSLAERGQQFSSGEVDGMTRAWADYFLAHFDLVKRHYLRVVRVASKKSGMPREPAAFVLERARGVLDDLRDSLVDLSPQPLKLPRVH